MKKLYCLLIAGIFISGHLFSQTKLAAGEFADGDLIEVPNNAALNLGSGEFTIEAWIQHDVSTTVAAPMIICKKNDGVNANGWEFGINAGSFGTPGKMSLAIKGNDFGPGFGGFGEPGVTAIDLRDGKCHHIAFTREKGKSGSTTDTIRGYQDGEYVKGSKKELPQVDGNLDNTDDITIGSSYFTPTSDYHFSGLIKEVRIWKVKRTAKQIDDNKGKWLKGNETGLVAYWRLNDNSGTSAKDYAGSNNGIVKGAGWSDFCNIMEPLPAGIGDVNGTDAGYIQVYPNPASGVINLKDLSRDAFEVKLFDMNGRLALTQGLNGINTVDISSLESGVYMLLVNSLDGTFQKSTVSVK